MYLCVYYVTLYYQAKGKRWKIRHAEEMRNEYGTTVTPFIYRFSVRTRNAAYALLIPSVKPIFSAGPEPVIDIRCLVPPIDIAYARLLEREIMVL